MKMILPAWAANYANMLMVYHLHEEEWPTFPYYQPRAAFLVAFMAILQFT